MIQIKTFYTLLTTLVAAAGLWVGCGEDEMTDVGASGEIVGRSHEALGLGQIQWANGYYTGCAARNGGWSVRVSGNNAMTFSALSVVKNDTGCALTLTGLVADKTYTTTTEIALGTSYLANGSPFGTGGPVDFFANAKLSANTFAGAFTVQLLFSADSTDQSTSSTASYAAASSTATESQVPPPSYTLSFAGVGVQTDISDVVQSMTGSVGVVPAGQSGEEYVISSDQSLGNTYAAFDAAYVGGSKKGIPADTPIASATWSLVGETLPVVRTVIIVHSQNGVRAYQVIRVTFNKAP